MDLENGGGGGGAANNQQGQPQQDEAGGGVQLAIPDPAADYLTSGEMAVLCVLAVVLSSLGALLLGLAFGTIPLEIDKISGQFSFQSYSDERAFVAELTCGLVGLCFGCGFAAILALRCCCGSHSLVA